MIEKSSQSTVWSQFNMCPANIRLDEDVLKTSWRRLEDDFSVTFFCLSRRLQDVLKTSSRHNCKNSSWRRLEEDVLHEGLEDVLKTSRRRLAKTFWRRLEDVFGRGFANTSGRRREDVLENEELLHWRRLQDVFKTSWKTRNVCWVVPHWRR